MPDGQTSDLRGEVAAAYQAGTSVAEIACQHGRSDSWVARILAAEGVQRRGGWEKWLDPDRVVADRHGRSITWVRATLASLGIPRRPRGGVYKEVSNKLIVRLRDDVCLSWEEIAAQVGMRPETVAARYASAPSGLDQPRYNFAGARADLAAWLRNDAANHREEIVADYRSGQTAEALARRWGISPRTVSRWAAAGE